MDEIRSACRALFTQFQDKYCREVEVRDSSSFLEERWKKSSEDQAIREGNGRTRILKGDVFEQAGVNFSEVQGILPSAMSLKLTGDATPQEFYATGVSIVIHPLSPHIPTTHANIRYLEVGELSWFGGGADLTPFVLYSEDASHFHNVLGRACDTLSPDAYDKYKQWCDRYFYLPHRGEHRGIGGIFYDYLGKEETQAHMHKFLQFTDTVSKSFIDAYLPIADKRKDTSWTAQEKQFQLLRRGRYVEFNLLQDRGTKFGLSTNGRTKSILMSLPPTVHWDEQFEPSSHWEKALLEVICTPQEWRTEQPLSAAHA